MKSMLLGLLSAGTIGAITICGPCSPVVGDAAASSPPEGSAMHGAEADTSTVRLRIEGMTCGGCAVSTRILLQRVDGVKSAEVDYEKRLAVVRYDDGRVSPERLIAVLKEKLQYTATVIPEEK